METVDVLAIMLATLRAGNPAASESSLVQEAVRLLMRANQVAPRLQRHLDADGYTKYRIAP